MIQVQCESPTSVLLLTLVLPALRRILDTS